MASRCACQRQLEPPGGTTCSETGLADCGQPRSCALGLGWGWGGSAAGKTMQGGQGGGGGRGRIFALPPHPALSIPTTTTAADPPGTGQARPRRPLFASRRARMGVPVAARPAGGAIWAEWGTKMAHRIAHGGAIGAAGGLRLVIARGSAAPGLVGHPLGAWGAAGRGSAGVGGVPC